MECAETIKTVIIDDDKEFIFSLKEHLSFFPEIDLLGESSQYVRARKLLTSNKPDLVFLDIEMPCKNGFELLREVRQSGCDNLSVIFYTAYDKYMIEALRESALDYILKPVDREELKRAIQRYKDRQKAKKEKSQQVSLYQGLPGMPDMAALPTSTGIRFIDKNSIVVFQCLKKSHREKPVWNAMLNDFSQFRLRSGITAREIMGVMGEHHFVVVNQSSIVNVNYLAAIEFKTRDCLLVPPYNEVRLTVSRSQLSELRGKFDVL